MSMEPVWQLRIMAWVSDAIMKNGSLARENGGSFWTKLTMVDEEDRKDGFLERENQGEEETNSIEELERRELSCAENFFPLHLR